ncbi:MAG: RHS repeat protein [Planctomycetes bacterium]|nr:RHS repeat protein [Planctomycetota bacterium]
MSADGLFVETDPGSGIVAPGWHAFLPGVSGSGGPPVPPGTPIFDALGNPVGVAGSGGPNGEPPIGADGLPIPTPGTLFGPPSAEPDQGVGNGDGKGPDAEPSEGCQVTFHNGEERSERVDLAIPGRGQIHFELRRRYKSRIVYNGPLGHNWDFTYHQSLYADTNGDMVRLDGYGHVDRWVRQPNGTYQPPRGYWSTLKRNDDGSWIVREPSGFKRHYFANGLLRANEDRFGNRMLFEYDGAGRLDLVIDVYGREIDFVWAVAPDGFVRLSTVTDYAGREVRYTYDTRGDLIEVRSPVVVGTSTGNDFPLGRTERYTYTSGFSDERLNHNLESVTLPEEVAKGGPPVLQWTYGTNPADPDTYDRVLTLVTGGTNASGVAAGGTKTFAYQSVTPPAPGPNAVVLRVTYTDRNLNVTEYGYNATNQAVAVRQLTRGVRIGEPAFYETINEYDVDGQLVRRVFPEGNEVRYTYQTGARSGQRNVVEQRSVAGPRGGGEDLVTTFTYEPLYNRVASVTDPRGNASGYVAPIGTVSAARYTSRVFYDYQEHSDPVDQALEFGIDLSSVARGLGDLNDDGRTDQSSGNTVRTEAPTVTLYPGGPLSQRLATAIQEIVTQTQWNDSGQLLAAIDQEGNVTTTEHHPENDADGDGIPVFSIYADLLGSSPTGYIRGLTADAAVSPRRTSTTPPAALRSEIRYDTVGNVVMSRNPRGIETHLEVTALNETIVVKRGADLTEALFQGALPVGTASLGYLTRMIRDHNGRVIRTEVESRDGNTVGVGAFIEQTTVFDILSDAVTSRVEVDAQTTLTSQLRYDGNQNLTEATLPEGNKVRMVYDERDLVFTTTRGFGAAEASTTRRDYDLNGNAVRLTDAEDNDGDSLPESTLLAYDGFDRLLTTTDALGNQSVAHYDVASNLIRSQVFGHAAGQPGTANVLLSEATVIHDELNRACVSLQSLFVSSGFTAARPPQLLDGDSDGWVQTVVEFDALNRTVFVVEDDGEVSETVYDGVSRPIESIDALGNRSLTVYDRNSNPVSSTSVEVSPEGLVPTETFTTRYVYDQLDRLVRATDNAGQTSRFAYDSRNNLVQKRDPEGTLTADPLGLFPGQINGPGNSKTYVYDGLNRMIRQVCDLRVGGTGAGALDTSNAFNPDGQVSLSYEFDGNSRLTGIVDDNGNRTRNRYDALNRRITHIYAIDQADTGGRRERFDYV